MKQKLFDKFAELFGNSDGVNFYFSPGRVNLIGEHTDYNGGHVFPCALTLGTYGAARKREDRKIHFYSMNLDSFGVVEASLDDLTNKKEYNWANYPLGVVWAFAEKGHPISSGFDMVIWGNIPNGSGLSSSASLEVLTGVILSDLFDIKDLSMTDLALIGQYSENNFNGCNCGIMDQFASAMGKKDHAIFLDRFHPSRFLIIQGDRKHFQSRIMKFIIYIFDINRLFPARRTPRCPEIQNKILTPERGKFYRAIIHRFHLEIGCYHARGYFP